MTLIIQLSDVVHRAEVDISKIRDFMLKASQGIEGRVRAPPVLSPSEMKELHSLEKFRAGTLDKKGPITISLRVVDYATRHEQSATHRYYLAEMALSYLIARQEAFIKDYLLQLLLHRRELLKSNASVTYDELARYRTLNAVWSERAKKEVDDLGGIDKAAQYFGTKLRIDLSTFQHWDTLRENSYRRNLIIHRRGRVDDTYRNKTGYKDKNGRLSTSVSYVTTAFGNTMAFIEFIHLSVCAKFKLTRE